MLNAIKAIIKKFEDGHREMWIEDCPIWGFKDIFNVHDIINKETMIKCLTEEYPKGNNNMCFLQEEYPEISDSKNRIKTKESAKILNLKYDVGTEYFYGDIASTNQNFIDCVELMKRLPRIHPAYLGTNNQIVNDIINTLLDTDSWRAKTVTNFDELLFWLAEFDLSHIPLDIEEVEDSETPTPKNDDECHPHPFTNPKSLNPMQVIRRENLKRAINAVLNRFADKIISEDGEPYSYERLSENHVTFKGLPKIDMRVKDNIDKIDICAFVDTPVISVTSDGATIILDNNGVDEIKNFYYPSFRRWAQTLYDMLVEERRIGWTSREDTLKEKLEKSEESRSEERMESCEASDDKEDLSKLIPKEELMKIIFENAKGILENNLDYHKYSWACPDNSWSLTSYEDSFRYVVYDRQNCVTKSIGCKLDKDHWEIYTEKGSNVNLVVYPDEARWMTNDPLFRNPHKDFPKEIFEDIIEDINTWIKTKTMSNKELSAFSQALIVDNKRPSKTDYYLAMAEVASTRGTCLRRRFGSVIVKDDRIVSTGYVGAPAGRKNCCDIGYCFRQQNNIPQGTMYERCRSSHSEMNAIINASKEEMKDSTLYLVGVEPDGKYTKADCCAMCKRAIINSGISKVVARQNATEFKEIDVNDWIVNDDSLDSDHKGY